MLWSAAQYMKFEDERTRPSRDLLAQVPSLPEGTLYDLGCGPGNSTELIRDRFSAYMLTGIDNDDDMLTAARKRMPGTPFHRGDLSTWAPPTQAVLFFANAVFQWLPDHLDVFDRLMGHLMPRGTLAVQMPDNLDQPSHRLMRELAADSRFAHHYSGITPRAILPGPSAYVDRLMPASLRVDVWHTVYYHRLAGPAAIVEWVKGTGLRPFLDPLPKVVREDYLAAYLEAIRQAYPPLADGHVLFPFPRLFIVAVKK